MNQLNDIYTFIMHYLGGTYISQVKAENKLQAMRFWIKSLKIEEIEGFSNADKQKLINKDFIDEEPALIQGMINVWCITVRTKKGFGIITFVKTDSAAR